MSRYSLPAGMAPPPGMEGPPVMDSYQQPPPYFPPQQQHPYSQQSVTYAPQQSVTYAPQQVMRYPPPLPTNPPAKRKTIVQTVAVYQGDDLSHHQEAQPRAKSMRNYDSGSESTFSHKSKEQKKRRESQRRRQSTIAIVFSPLGFCFGH
ncbi:hypothetical protein BASA81_003059 [Batrachochytrium salamandrivorans]|nr:hypothetical protein BASA81_003059 [Batrachochytrium salamandrivorans]